MFSVTPEMLGALLQREVKPPPRPPSAPQVDAACSVVAYDAAFWASFYSYLYFLRSAFACAASSASSRGTSSSGAASALTLLSSSLPGLVGGVVSYPYANGLELPDIFESDLCIDSSMGLGISASNLVS